MATGELHERVRVGVAELDVTSAGVLTTSGLGSCLGIALYDETTGVAGLAHLMLPSAGESTDGTPAKFVDTGIPALLSAMAARGADTDAVTAKLAGGSDMYSFAGDDPPIGQRNVEAARATLDRLDVPVVAENVGGNHGRSLRFDAANGELLVRNANCEDVTV